MLLAAPFYTADIWHPYQIGQNRFIVRKAGVVIENLSLLGVLSQRQLRNTFPEVKYSQYLRTLKAGPFSEDFETAGKNSSSSRRGTTYATPESADASYLEEWRYCPGMSRKYQISSFGRVRSRNRDSPLRPVRIKVWIPDVKFSPYSNIISAAGYCRYKRDNKFTCGRPKNKKRLEEVITADVTDLLLSSRTSATLQITDYFDSCVNSAARDTLLSSRPFAPYSGSWHTLTVLDYNWKILQPLVRDTVVKYHIQWSKDKSAEEHGVGICLTGRGIKVPRRMYGASAATGIGLKKERSDFLTLITFEHHADLKAYLIRKEELRQGRLNPDPFLEDVACRKKILHTADSLWDCRVWKLKWVPADELLSIRSAERINSRGYSGALSAEAKEYVPREPSQIWKDYRSAAIDCKRGYKRSSDAAGNVIDNVSSLDKYSAGGKRLPLTKEELMRLGEYFEIKSKDTSKEIQFVVIAFIFEVTPKTISVRYRDYLLQLAETRSAAALSNDNEVPLFRTEGEDLSAEGKALSAAIDYHLKKRNSSVKVGVNKRLFTIYLKELHAAGKGYKEISNWLLQNKDVVISTSGIGSLCREMEGIEQEESAFVTSANREQYENALQRNVPSAGVGEDVAADWMVSDLSVNPLEEEGDLEKKERIITAERKKVRKELLLQRDEEEEKDKVEKRKELQVEGKDAADKALKDESPVSARFDLNADDDWGLAD